MSKRTVSKKLLAIFIVVIVVAATIGVVYYYQSLTRPKPVIVIGTWGGPWSAAMEQIMKGFASKYNVEVRIVSAPAEELVARMRAEKGHPTMDIVHLGPANLLGSIKEGLTYGFTGDEVPNTQKLLPVALWNQSGKIYGAANQITNYGLSYRTDKFPTAPTSWKWAWSPDLYPKKFAMASPAWNYGFGLVLWAWVWGGDEHHMDIAFQKAKELAPNLGFVFTTHGQARRLVTTGDLWAMPDYTGGAISLAKGGVPLNIVYPKDAPIYTESELLCPVTNGPAGRSLQLAALDWMLSAESESYFNSVTVAGNTNPGATLPANLTRWMVPSDQLGQLRSPDWAYMVQHSDEWLARWQTEVVPLLGK